MLDKTKHYQAVYQNLHISGERGKTLSERANKKIETQLFGLTAAFPFPPRSLFGGLSHYNGITPASWSNQRQLFSKHVVYEYTRFLNHTVVGLHALA